MITLKTKVVLFCQVCGKAYSAEMETRDGEVPLTVGTEARQRVLDGQFICWDHEVRCEGFLILPKLDRRTVTTFERDLDEE